MVKQKNTFRHILSFTMSCVMFLSIILPQGMAIRASAAGNVADHVVISQIYPSGGNVNSSYGYDFIELYNPTDQPQDLTGWSVQYGSAGGTFTRVTPLYGIIKPHSYYLIQQLAGIATNNPGGPLPVNADLIADSNTGFDIAASNGKVALVKSTTLITGSSHSNVIDFVGYGTANDYYTTVAPAFNNINTISLLRKTNSGTDPFIDTTDGNGWDTRNNGEDFILGNVVPPRNSGSLSESPVIQMQPMDQIVNVGAGSPILSIVASVNDGGTLSYQWYSNTTNSNSGGTLISGATGPAYAAPTTTAGTTYYYVVVTNSNNSASGIKTSITSSAAKITVNTLVNAETPIIVTQPADQTVIEGDSLLLGAAATVSDSGTLSYQWYSNTTNNNSGGTLISGATGPTFSPPTTTAGTMYYYVVVTNTNNSVNGVKTAAATSGAAKVTVNTLVNAETPSLGMQPADQTVIVGDSALVSAAATVSDNGVLSYQWYSNTVNSNSGGTLISGATGPTYAPPTTTAGTTYYYVVVTNMNNSVNGTKTAAAASSAAKVTVNTLVNAETPSIITQPADQTVIVGDSALVSAVASVNDGGTLSYQWYSNTTNSNSGGTLISGETGTTYAPPTTTAGITYYYVVVTNTNNSVNGVKTATVTSSAARVTVNTLVNAETPSIVTQPADQTVTVGSSAFVSATATVSDSGALSYQWYSNTTNSNSGGTLISGATGPTYAAPTTTASTTYYYVVVTNTNNSVNGTKTAMATSSAAKITINTLVNAETPSIVMQPADQAVIVGDSSFLSVAATVSDSGTLSYQWYSNTTNSNSGGTLISGEIGTTYTPPTTTAGTTHYYVVVTNTNNSVNGAKTATATSSAAKITVNTLVNAETPSISMQLVDQTVAVGGSALLSASATVTDNGVLSYQWYSNTTHSNSGGTLISSATDATYAAPTTTVGTTFYYVVVTNTNNSVNGTQTAIATSSAAKVTVNTPVNNTPVNNTPVNTAPVNTAPVNTTPVITPVITPVNAETPSISTQPVDQTVTVGDSALLSASATVTDNGALSYQWYSNTTHSNSGGTLINSATDATYAAPTTTVGTTFYYVVVTNTNNSVDGTQTATATSSAAKVTVVNVAPSYANKTAKSSFPDYVSGSQESKTMNTGVSVLVNGKEKDAAIVLTASRDNQTVTIVSIDQKKLDDILAMEGLQSVVTISVNTKSDVILGELNGQLIKNMEIRQAVLEIKTSQATYKIPAKQINIDSLSSQIGKSIALQDIKVQIEIASVTESTVKTVESAAAKGMFTPVVPPVAFAIRGIYGDTTIEVSKFQAYVERAIALPDGVDANKITTGVVIEPNGTVRHVPTKVVVIDEHYYAIVNSLTNSVYSVIWHPLEFSDLDSHWSKTAVNDMGSRMIVNGIGSDQFSPDRDITRAEFISIIVRGLGLKPESGESQFTDVKTSDWYSSAINTAAAYHLIEGFEDGTVRPNEKITREQAMVMIAKAMQITELKMKLSVQTSDVVLQSFTDASDASNWAKSGIADSVQAGIVSGRSSTELAPKAYITRAEVTAIIQRLLQKSGLI
ncbi:hypothetical protein YSY43_30390 [Paenibacillus sp. YSY-4.3]